MSVFENFSFKVVGKNLLNKLLQLFKMKNSRKKTGRFGNDLDIEMLLDTHTSWYLQMAHRYERRPTELRDSKTVALGWTCAVLNGMHEGH